MHMANDTTPLNPPALVAEIRRQLQALGDPQRAMHQARYMKHRQEFMGVAMPQVREIARQCYRRYTPANAEDFRLVLTPLWKGKWREERYVAQLLAERWRVWQWPDALEDFAWMVRTGQWWDVVDAVATRLVGRLLLAHPQCRETVYAWIEDEDMWIRRTALLCQLNHKANTNEEALTRMILQVAHEEAFFTRKAIGWALRQYARTNPTFVREFVNTNQSRLSTLSRREALKNL